jgi:hypothetical protein
VTIYLEEDGSFTFMLDGKHSWVALNLAKDDIERLLLAKEDASLGRWRTATLVAELTDEASIEEFLGAKGFLSPLLAEKIMVRGDQYVLGDATRPSRRFLSDKLASQRLRLVPTTNNWHELARELLEINSAEFVQTLIQQSEETDV